MKPSVAFSLGVRPLLRTFRGGSSGHQLVGTIFGIALSLIPLVLVIQVSGGMIEGITSRYLETYTYHLQIQSYNSDDPEVISGAAEKIAGCPGIQSITLERQGFGLAYAPEGGREGVTLRSLPADLYEKDEGFRRYITFQEGAWDLSRTENALLGEQLARKLGVHPGDSVKVLTAKNLPGRGYIPRVTTLQVTGIFTTGYQDLDKMWLVVNHQQGERILFKGTSQTFLGLKVEEPYRNLRPVVTALKETLSAGWGIYTWESLNSSQNQNFQTTKALLLFITGLILCVAVVNISSSLIMMVLENQHEIAIMKSLGASPGGITLAYVVSGTLAGLAGMFLGLAGGLLLAVNVNEIILGLEGLLNALAGFYHWLNPWTEGTGSIDLLSAQYYLEEIPLRISWIEIALTGAGTVILSFLVSWWPARKAARIRPLEVLRRV